MKKTIICLALFICCGCSSNRNESQVDNHGECFLINDSNSSLCVGLDDSDQIVTSMRVIVSYDSFIISKIINSEESNEIEAFYNDMIKQNMEYKQQDENDGYQDYWVVNKEKKEIKPDFSSHYDIINENEVFQNYYYQEVVYFNFLDDEFDFKDEKIKQRLNRYGIYNAYSQDDNAIMYEALKQNVDFKYHYFFETGNKVKTPEEFNPHI